MSDLTDSSAITSSTLSTNTHITLTINGCARCGNTHMNVLAKRFNIPVSDPVGNFTHWVMCPYSHDPVLVRISASLTEVTDDN